jgi:phytoene synthase
MQDAFLHCEELVRAGDKDRYLATLFAPAKYRRALFALYAFNFEVARVREVAHEAMAGEIRLHWWNEVLSGSGREEVAAHPVAAALRDVVVRYALPPRMLADLIEARRFDLYNDPMQDIAALEHYAARTSSTLMELAARILGDGRDPGGRDFFRHAGIAYAMGGLLASFAIHASRGQLYVPLEVLNRHRARAVDVYAGKPTGELRAALAEMRLHARGHLSRARQLAGDLPESAMPAVLPLVLVRPTLVRMERRLYRPFRVTRLAQWRRQWILWRAARGRLEDAL